MSEPILRLFTGDPYRCEQALAQRETAIRGLDSGCERRLIHGDEADVGTLEIELRSTSLFALAQHFVVRRVERMRAPHRLSKVLLGDLPEGTFVTLLASELKASHPVLKAGKARAAHVSLPAPRGRAVTNQARAVFTDCGLEPSADALKEVVFRCGGDLLSIAQEARKLRSYTRKPHVEEETVARLVFPSGEPSVFPFYDRVGEGDLRGALSALGDLREDPGRILGGTVRHLARLTMIRLLQNRNVGKERTANLVGLPDWLLYRLAGQARRHPFVELRRALDLGVRLDVHVKQGRLHAYDALLKIVFAVTCPARSAPG